VPETQDGRRGLAVGGGAHGVRQRGDFFEIGVFFNPNHKPETPEILEIWKSLKSLNPWKFGDVEIVKSFKKN